MLWDATRGLCDEAATVLLALPVAAITIDKFAFTVFARSFFPRTLRQICCCDTHRDHG